MAGCNCGGGQENGGPYAEGRELVEFVARAHGGALRTRPIPGGGLATFCQGCSAPFLMETHVARCPLCDGVHAVSPPRAGDAANIQYAGADFRLEDHNPAETGQT